MQSSSNFLKFSAMMEKYTLKLYLYTFSSAEPTFCHEQPLKQNQTGASEKNEILQDGRYPCKRVTFAVPINSYVLSSAFDQQKQTNTGCVFCICIHRRMGHGFRFLLPFSLLPPPFFSKFSYKSFLFQNVHNHSFFLHLTISVDVIHHE